jgi:NAD(P)-dependent dehydrogenase (short-subunit alcohol dehydrogenase family)
MTDLPNTPGFELEGKRALVTGASRGIGLAAAAALAQAGAEVTLIARSQNDIQHAAEAINNSGGKAHFQTLNVSQLDKVEAFFAERPAFHILVNNAGTNRPKPLIEVTEDDYEAVLDLNLKSAIFVSQACARQMLHEKVSGSIIHISSQLGHVGSPNRSLYCASKWGLEGFSKALALELAPHGIRSNTICPTYIETPLTQPYFEDKAFLESVLKNIKLGRLGQVEDLMGPVVFLASEASALMTGSSMMLDGGWTAE